MPYNKEQLREYWQANKAILNQKRREKRRLAKLGLIFGEVSQKQEKVSHQSPMVSLETANLNPVSHGKSQNGKPYSKMANPILAKLIQEWQTSTNYSCPPTCAYSYCNNCWYFVQDNLLDYKEVSRIKADRKYRDQKQAKGLYD